MMKNWTTTSVTSLSCGVMEVERPSRAVTLEHAPSHLLHINPPFLATCTFFDRCSNISHVPRDISDQKGTLSILESLFI